MNWRDYIVVDPAVLVGKPVVKGTRISVELILDRPGGRLESGRHPCRLPCAQA